METTVILMRKSESLQNPLEKLWNIMQFKQNNVM